MEKIEQSIGKINSRYDMFPCDVIINNEKHV